MRVLALDTSTWWGSVALLEGAPAGPRIVGEFGVRVRDSHARHLIRWIAQLLEAVGWRRSDVEGWVATHGPGSFTGIRVGLGTIRGLSLATGRPCAGVTTLDALAEAYGPAEVDRFAVLDAGRGELFAARYAPDSSPAEAVEGPWLDRPERLRARAGSAGTVLIPGPGSENVVRRCDVSGARCVAPPRGVAAAAGRLAILRGALDEKRAATLAPLYLRPADAQLPRRP